MQISSIYYLIAITQNLKTEKTNQLKIVLEGQGNTRKRLAELLGKNEATISRWRSNATQPSLEMLMKIAEILEVNAKDLINKEVNSIKQHG